MANRFAVTHRSMTKENKEKMRSIWEMKLNLSASISSRILEINLPLGDRWLLKREGQSAD